MSLFNILFGVNPDSEKLMAILRSVDESFSAPRLRDCYFNGEHIVVHTRTGGGNREDYEEDNDAMTRHPWYVRDEDDDFDSTYADWYFKAPEAITEGLNVTDITPAQKWQLLFEALEKKPDVTPN